MEYLVSDIIDKVRIVMDETVNVVSPLFDATALDLDTIIRQSLPDAVKAIHNTAPTHLLDGKIIASTPVNNQDGSGCILLPDDFMRLIIFKLDGWKRPVVIPITDQHPDYILQKNKYVRGGTDKPVCAITTNRSGKKILEYYSLPGSYATHTISQALYIPVPEIIDNKIDISPRVLSPVLYQCAALTYIVSKRTDIANYLFDIVPKLIQ